MNKIITILRKEWAEVFKNRLVLFTVAFLPLIMTALPLGTLLALGSETEMAGMTGEIPEQFLNYCPSNLNPSECMQVYLVSQFMLMFLILPLAIPATIASYSIVGEKTTRTLEPLLATPITTTELLIGKSLAAAIPAIVATYAGFLIFAASAWFIIDNPVLYQAVIGIRWIAAIFLLGPLMALSAVCVSVMVSSRVNDPRVAEQVSMIVIMPLLGIFFAQITGFLLVSLTMVLIAAAILLAVDAWLLFLAVQLFQRENILTRWK